MAVNLIETLQKNTGFSGIQKIDPNTQEVKKPEEMAVEDYLGQAALPVILIGIYKYTRTDEGNTLILNGGITGFLLNIIFGNQKAEVVSKVASYTGNSDSFAESKMETIAQEAVKIIRENLPKDATNQSVKDLLTSQRHEIISYLPTSLQIGKTLNDETIDDKTNKMEGPVSGIMHAIGQVFSSSGNDKKEEQNF